MCIFAKINFSAVFYDKFQLANHICHENQSYFCRNLTIYRRHTDGPELYAAQTRVPLLLDSGHRHRLPVVRPKHHQGTSHLLPRRHAGPALHRRLLPCALARRRLLQIKPRTLEPVHLGHPRQGPGLGSPGVDGDRVSQARHGVLRLGQSLPRFHLRHPHLHLL